MTVLIDRPSMLSETERYDNVRMVSQYADTIVIYFNDLTKTPVWVEDVPNVACVTTMDFAK